MTDNDLALRRRFTELADRAETRRQLIFSDFLNINEQSILQSTRLQTKYMLFGGYTNAERKVACFGTADAEEVAENAPFMLLKVSPAVQKFADALTHRDFLGSILALGLRREVIGDIVLLDNCGYIFCMDSMSDYILENLERVRRTTVRVTVADKLPDALYREPEAQSVVVASERLDALLAAVFRLSRGDAQKLVASERVFADSRILTRADAVLKSGCMVSARGFGRFRYLGVSRETKKGKLRVEVQIYK